MKKMTKYHININRANQYFLIYYYDRFGEWPYYDNIPYHSLLKAHKNCKRVINNPNSLYNKVNFPYKRPNKNEKK